MADPSLHRTLGLLLRDVAARAILPRWQALHAADIAEKAPGDFVTIADHEAEQQLTEALLRLMPGARVVGEEAVAQNPDLLDGLETGLVWLVDPLDGTANFIAGSPHFAVMVALVDNGDVQAGWVYHPARGRLYQAQAGAGAQMNGAPLVAQGSGNSGLVAAFPTRYTPPDQQQVITDLKAQVATALPGLLCAGVDYTRCIDGTQDFALFWRSLPWDHAPGSLILREAGGWAGWRDGTPYRVGDQRPGLMALSAPDLLARLG